MSPEVLKSSIDVVNLLSTSGEQLLGVDLGTESIDWDISIDNSIDWDIGNVGCSGEADNGFQIVNADEYLVNLMAQNVGDSVPNLADNAECRSNSRNYKSEICWDISVEDIEKATLGDVVLLDAEAQTGLSSVEVLAQSQGVHEQRSQLLETEYRNKILDDLFEVFFLIFCYCAC